MRVRDIFKSNLVPEQLAVMSLGDILFAARIHISKMRGKAHQKVPARAKSLFPSLTGVGGGRGGQFGPKRGTMANGMIVLPQTAPHQTRALFC